MDLWKEKNRILDMQLKIASKVVKGAVLIGRCIGVQSLLTGVFVEVCGVWGVVSDLDIAAHGSSWEKPNWQVHYRPSPKQADIHPWASDHDFHNKPLNIPAAKTGIQTHTHTHSLADLRALRAWRWEAVSSSPRHVDQRMSYREKTGRRASL